MGNQDHLTNYDGRAYMKQLFRRSTPSRQVGLLLANDRIMLAAVGNRVEKLHRSRIGGLALPEDLQPGQWRWVTPDELASLKG